jgi:hypothetical protein
MCAPPDLTRCRHALFLFVIVVVFPELGFFFAKQFLDTARRSSSVVILSIAR